jgi:catechol 2,3-dioxygenase-like lactoylglutathione lyase family enzyme
MLRRSLLAIVVLASAASAQGRCIRAYGTPACNTDSIKAVFDKTGWRTVALEHITWRVAEPQKEAAFYAALMGWKFRSDDGKKVVMDMGDWGSAIFRKVSADSFAAPAPAGGGDAAAGAGGGRGGGGRGRGGAGGAAANPGAGATAVPAPAAVERVMADSSSCVGKVERGGGRGPRIPLHVAVEGYGFVIEPWNAKAVEAELKKRGMNPVAENGPNGFESFHVKDTDGFDLQLSNGKGLSAARKKPSTAKNSEPAPFESTGWNTVWLDHFSYGAADYKASVSFYVQLLGWGMTYDEGSQNELMMGDVGNTIIRGGNRLDPAFGQGAARRAGAIDHISFGISPWNTDKICEALESRGLTRTIDTSDGMQIHSAMFKSYHTTTPNGFNLQISYNTHDTRLNLAVAVNPRRPGNR